MEPRLDPEPTDAGRPVPIGRRRALTLLAGAGASAVALAACGGSGGDSTAATTTSTTGSPTGRPSAAARPVRRQQRQHGDDGTIPEETAGPYPGDGSNGPNVLTESGVVRSDIRSSFGVGVGHRRGRAADHRRSTVVDTADGCAPLAGRRGLPLALRPRGPLLAVLGRRRPTRTTCAACRRPTPTGGSRSPASSRAPTRAAGRTSTSRSIRRWPRPPAPASRRHVAARPARGRVQRGLRHRRATSRASRT